MVYEYGKRKATFLGRFYFYFSGLCFGAFFIKRNYFTRAC